MHHHASGSAVFQSPRLTGTAFPSVGAGFVESLAQPGGNVTGFMLFEYSFSGKWLELLKEIAPTVTRAAVGRPSAYRECEEEKEKDNHNL